MIVMAFHTRNATIRRIEPDRVVFELDRREGLSWAHLGEAAVLTQTCPPRRS